MKPELSVCIASYNSGDRIISCVENILSYNGDEIEVVVVDNASEDNSVNKLKRILDKRLKIVVNEENIGPFRNFYKALATGEGRYIMLLHEGDDIVVENLPVYLEFLRNSEYDIIKNAYKNMEHVSGAVSGAKMQYYGKIFSHHGQIVYKRDSFLKIEPMECSFDSSFCAYPYFVWETQMLAMYPIYSKRSYINGEIEIIRILEKRIPSRTRSYVNKKAPSSYTFENAVYMFDKQIGLLRKLYVEDRYFSRLCCNLYRGDLFCGTNWFYEHMKNPEMKQRYMPEIEEPEIDYLKLNNNFLNHAIQMIKLDAVQMRWVLYAKLYIITCRNRLWFKLNHVYKRSFGNPQYFVGCVINKGLTCIVNVIA